MSTSSKRSLENELSLLNAYSESLQNVLKIEKELSLLRRKSENTINSFKNPSLYSDDVHVLPSRSSIKHDSNKIVTGNSDIVSDSSNTSKLYTQYKTDNRNTETPNSKYIFKHKTVESSNKRNAARKSHLDHSMKLSLHQHNINFAKERHKLHKYRNSLTTSESSISAAFEKIINCTQDESNYFLDDNSNISSEADSDFNLDKTEKSNGSTIDHDIKNLSINLARHFNGLYTHIISQYVRDEKLLSKYFDVIRNFREKIALSTVKSELVRLKIKKNHAVDPNHSLKKKQRALLIKLQHEYNEIKFMRNYQKKLSDDRKRILYRQLKHFKTMFTINVDRRDFGSKFYLRNANLSALKENGQKSPIKCHHSLFKNINDESTIHKHKIQQKKFLTEHKRKLNDLLLLHFDLQLNSAILDSIKHKYSNTEIINVLKEFSEKSKTNTSDLSAAPTNEIDDSNQKIMSFVQDNHTVDLIDDIEKIDRPSSSSNDDAIPSTMRIGRVNMDNVSNVRKISNGNKYLIQFHNHDNILNKFALENKKIILKIINGDGKLIQISFKNLTDDNAMNNNASIRAITSNGTIQKFIANPFMRNIDDYKINYTISKNLILNDLILRVRDNAYLNNKFHQLLSSCMESLKSSNCNLQTIANNFFEIVITRQKKIRVDDFSIIYVLDAIHKAFKSILVKNNPRNLAEFMMNLENVTNKKRSMKPIYTTPDKIVPIVKSNSAQSILNKLHEKHFHGTAQLERAKESKVETPKIHDSFVPERNLRGLVPVITPKSMSQIEEAEELRKKQLAVELEIKTLLEQQKSQLSYFVVREIPDKPPPPYIPPSDDTKLSVGTSTDPIPFNDASLKYCEISDMIRLCNEHVWSPFMAKTYPSQPDANANFKRHCVDAQKNVQKFTTNVFLFDLCNEQYVAEYRDVNTKKNQWEYKRSLLHYKRSNVCQTVENSVRQILGYGKPVPKDNMFINCAHKVQDHVDELLIRELQEEEPEWVNFEEYEVRLKNSITEVILNALIVETVNEFKLLYK